MKTNHVPSPLLSFYFFTLSDKHNHYFPFCSHWIIFTMAILEILFQRRIVMPQLQGCVEPGLEALVSVVQLWHILTVTGLVICDSAYTFVC